MATRVTAAESYLDIHFATAGVDVSTAYAKQPARKLPDKTYARTAAEGVNVRTYDPDQDRRRGGSRPGLQKFFPLPVVEDWIVQMVAVVVHVEEPV